MARRVSFVSLLSKLSNLSTRCIVVHNIYALSMFRRLWKTFASSSRHFSACRYNFGRDRAGAIASFHVLKDALCFGTHGIESYMMEIVETDHETYEVEVIVCWRPSEVLAPSLTVWSLFGFLFR
jgi:hypothetical protein